MFIKFSLFNLFKFIKFAALQKEYDIIKAVFRAKLIAINQRQHIIPFVKTFLEFTENLSLGEPHFVAPVSRATFGLDL